MYKTEPVKVSGYFNVSRKGIQIVYIQWHSQGEMGAMGKNSHEAKYSNPFSP